MSSPSPLLSVIVPVYNVAPYLDECLESLLHQGLSSEELEVILVDDGSTDGSDLIANKWAAREANFIVHTQTNGGLSAARNTGLDLARGQFIVFFDSDDIIPPLAYKRMLEQLVNSGSDFITSPAYRFSIHNPLATPVPRNIDLFEEPRTGITLEDYPEFIRDFTAWNKIYRRQFFLNSGVRFPVGRIYEDVATSPLLYHKARSFDVFTEPGYFWRLTPGSITQSVKPVKALDRLWALQYIQEYFESAGASSALKEALGFAIVDYNLRWIFLDFHAFDPQTQTEILTLTHTILQDVSIQAIHRAPAPLKGWAEACKKGELDSLSSELQTPQRMPNNRPDEDESKLTTRTKNRRHQAKERLDHLIFNGRRQLKHALVYLLLRPLVLALPLDSRRAVFSNYWGQKFSRADGPATLSLKLAEEDPTFTNIVVASPKHLKRIRTQVEQLKPRKAKITVIKDGSLRFYYNIWRAKYLFNDVNFQLGFRVDKCIEKRPGQIEVQTTHGIPLKKMGLDSSDAIEPTEHRKFLARSARYDYLVSTSPIVADVFSKAHNVTPEILKTGLPQNDHLFDAPTERDTRRIAKKYDIDPNKKTILYAPTFRGRRGSHFPYLIDFDQLQTLIGDDAQVIVKPHPFNHSHLSKIDFKHLLTAPTPVSPFIKLLGEIRSQDDYLVATADPKAVPPKPSISYDTSDINELLLIADVIITDYSSIIFSATLLNKPLILFTADNEHYSSSRGHYFEIESMAPGAVAHSTAELSKCILEALHDKDSWFDNYRSQREEFIEQFLLWEQGASAGQILQQVGVLESNNAN